MNAYRWSVQLKLGLIVFAVGIAVTSLWYTQRLVDRLQEREQAVIQLWADALEQVVQTQQAANPYRKEFRRLDSLLQSLEGRPVAAPLSTKRLSDLRESVDWARAMPPTREFNFILNEILQPDQFDVPAIITDSTGRRPLSWQNVGVPDTAATPLPAADSVEVQAQLRDELEDMRSAFKPIPVRIDVSDAPGREAGTSAGQLTQYVFYDESALITELRIFPWVQLVFVGLFVMVGYLGFSYIRRSEQSSLWMGMAREAAHQLGTPLSSLMGWIQMLRTPDLPTDQRERALTEIENDVERLQRVADRFSDIGSQPKLERCDLGPIIEQTARYLRRRIPQQGQSIALTVDLPDRLPAEANEELFAWVLENLLKNALDAIEDEEGRIMVTAWEKEAQVFIEVQDTGQGIEGQQWNNIFRPGYSTKKRGWGLGLSLARRVIESYHGGRLELASSTVGQGSTFRIEIPAADAA
ncbi:sensor histidine kinase [Salinibacter altiplanensis]|uniref:sensor histidine kinase n=1 Tax=Salinibacter altiplanensis TaxID=1803181 RepID=UPI000C9EC8DC|nr:HAMP domain-containing sensor histidine kinase [Salinibacter altiplanensis]